MTNLATDRRYLTTQTYATEEALAARIRTHQLYTRPQIDFMAWMLDKIPWCGNETTLDIGCGAGAYIEPVCARLKAGGRLLSADLSAGMLADVAAKRLAGPFSLLNAEAMALPLPDNACDTALANHMLYHMPNIARALREIRRVLRPGGYFMAATNARHSMQTFITEMISAGNALGFAVELPQNSVRENFNLENGGDIIGPVFPEAVKHTLDSQLVFPAAEPALAYINSMRAMYAPLLSPGLSWQALMAQVKAQIELKVRAQGEYRVAKTTGVFVAVCRG